jgi:outer membrane cobalamin receptor
LKNFIIIFLITIVVLFLDENLFSTEYFYLLPKVLISSSNSKVISKNNHIINGKNIEIISHKDIVDSATDTISQVLLQNASVQVRSSNSVDNPTFYLRGQRATILLNGRPLNQFDRSSQSLNMVPLSSISKVEIINSSSSVEYGSMGMGGVINIITNDPSQVEDKFFISPSYPQYGQAGISLSKYLGNDWGVALSNDLSNRLGSQDYSNALSTASELGLTKGYAEGKVNIRLNNGYQNLHYPGPINGTGKEHYISNTTQISINLEQNLSEKTKFIGYLLYRQMWANVFFPEFEAAQYSNQNYQIISFTPTLKYIFKIYGKEIDSLIGFDLSSQSFRQSAISFGSATQSEIAPFINSSLKFNKCWLMGFGLRFSDIEAVNNINSKRYNPYAFNVFVDYKWTPEIATSFRVAHAYQLPFIDNSLGVAPPSYSFNLRPESSMSYSINNSYNTNKVTLGLNIYFMNIRNQIYYISYNNNAGENMNLDPTQEIGGILSASYQFISQLNVGGSASVSNNIFRVGDYAGHQVPNNSNIQLEGHLVYRLTQSIDWYLQEQYYGSRYPQGDLENISNKVSAYFLTNTSLSYHISNWKIQFRVNNLLNKYYYSNVVMPMQDKLKLSCYQAEGINGYLRISYLFI